MRDSFEIHQGTGVGRGYPLLVLSGPCVIESLAVCCEVATTVRDICAELGLGYVFKASFDKANRTSVENYRGPGLREGLEILAEVKSRVGVPIVTDVHTPEQCAAAAEVVDILQIPAFLCRQTDLLLAAGETGRCVNVKKGQFLAPEDIGPALAKVAHTGNQRILATERGTTFGYRNLVVDMRALVLMREFGVPVVFDATHAVQIPGGQGTASGGRREFVPPLLRAAVATGVDAVFLETHPDPDQAKSDGPNSVRLRDMSALLRTARDLHAVAAR